MTVAGPNPAARARLVCFPHAGGGPSVFTAWARALAEQPIEIAAAHLPGRETRLGEPLPDDLDVVISALGDATAALADRPYALFGHSMGAVVAFEIARRLRDRGLPLPVHLFVSGAPAPQLPKVDARLRLIEGDGAFLEAVAQKYGGVPRIVLERAELRGDLVRALRADLALTETYAYRDAPPLPCAIAAYGGTTDTIVAGERLDAWRAQTTGAFSCRRFPGDHFYLNRQRDALLAEILSRM